MTNAFELIDPSVAAVWSLIHFFWQGAGLALVLAAALKISQRNSSDVRYLLCCAAMAGMALCPVLTLCSFELSGSGRSSFDRTESTLPDAAAAHGGQRSAAENGSRAMIDWTDRHMTVILSLWCAGVLIGLARLFVSLAAVRRLDSSSVGAAPNQLQSRADQVGLRLKLRGSVRLVVSGQVTAPVVAGWRKPIVIVPTSLLSGLSPQEEDSILAHELAHIRRRDYLVNVIQTALEGVLFYHPAVWWVSKQIRREREHCCDDFALSLSGSPLIYAKALTLLEEQRLPASPGLSLGVYGGDLSMRIKRLFERNHRMPLGRTTGFSLASLGVITLGALAMLSISAADRVNAQVKEAASQQNPVTANSTNQHHPDMSCTFYDQKNLAHPGVCQAIAENSGDYYCKQTDGNQDRQRQSGCEWKVQRLREWEKQQDQSK